MNYGPVVYISVVLSFSFVATRLVRGNQPRFIPNHVGVHDMEVLTCSVENSCFDVAYWLREYAEE